MRRDLRLAHVGDMHWLSCTSMSRCKKEKGAVVWFGSEWQTDYVTSGSYSRVESSELPWQIRTGSWRSKCSKKLPSPLLIAARRSSDARPMRR